MEAIDCLIEPRWVVPVEPHGVVLDWHAVAVRSGRIVAILPAAEARERFALSVATTFRATSCSRASSTCTPTRR
jgi:hypothetical protein